jgi:hypothetical protein
MSSWPPDPTTGGGDAGQNPWGSTSGSAQDRAQQQPTWQDPTAPPDWSAQPTSYAQPQPYAAGYPQAGYPQTGYAQSGYPAQANNGNGFAIASLVLGCTSIFFSWWGIGTLIQVVLAIVFGCMALGRVPVGSSQRTMAIAGIICGSIGGLLYLIIGIFTLGLFLVI